MSDKIKIELGPIQKTLLIPLWGRAKEYEKPDPLIRDKPAHDIISRLDFDFKELEANMVPQIQLNCAIRAFHLDNELKKLMEQYPDATIVNIGAGLDTTFQRIDNGRIHWYDLDMPDSIALRKQLIPETERNKYITSSAFEKGWYKEIAERGSKVIFIAAGVFVYFKEEQVKKLLLDLAEEFPGSDILFEAYSKWLLWLRNRKVSKQKEKRELLELMQWGLRSGKVTERWSRKIKLIEEYSFYSRVPVDENDKELVKQFKFMNWVKWFKIVHLRLG